MLFTQSLPLSLHKPDIIRIVAPYLLPVISEVAFYAILPFQFQIGLLHLFQQGATVPRSAVENRGHVGSGTHGAEFPAVLLLADILRFIDLKNYVGGMSHH